jgi:hypothetical protein
MLCQWLNAQPSRWSARFVRCCYCGTVVTVAERCRSAVSGLENPARTLRLWLFDCASWHVWLSVFLGSHSIAGVDIALVEKSIGSAKFSSCFPSHVQTDHDLPLRIFHAMSVTPCLFCFLPLAISTQFINPVRTNGDEAEAWWGPRRCFDFQNDHCLPQKIGGTVGRKSSIWSFSAIS